MVRGDLVTAVRPSDFGTPHPALLIQANQSNQHASATLLPITGTIVAAPLLHGTFEPAASCGLQKPSQVMLDKTMIVGRDKPESAFGRINADALVAVERCLAVFWVSPSDGKQWLGVADTATAAWLWHRYMYGKTRRVGKIAATGWQQCFGERWKICDFDLPALLW